MSDGIVITMQMIDDLVAETEATPPDLRTEVMVDDWIRLDMPGYNPFYSAGHIQKLWCYDGIPCYSLACGERETPRVRWIFDGWVTPPKPNVKLIEHWRKIGRVVREPNVITVDSVWVQIVHQEVPDGLDTPA